MSIDRLPSPAEAAALPLDRLAMHLLAFLRAQDESGVQLDLRNAINTGLVREPLSIQETDSYLQALTEAWDWLVCRGLIAGSHPRRSSSNATFITRHGYAVLDDPNGLARISA